MKKVVFLFALSLLLFSQLHAQLTLQGELRPRFEYRGGYGKVLAIDEKPVLTISQRSRLSAYYQTGILNFGFAIQDVRVWGDDDQYAYSGVPGSKSSIDLNEAWLSVKPYKSGLIKIGRQYWSYEDERLISSRAWNQSEVKYDAVLFQHKQEKMKFDVGLSWNNSSELLYEDVFPANKMKSLNFIYLNKGFSDWLNVSVMALASGFTASDTTTEIYWQGTYGAYLRIKKGNLNALASGFYQAGENRKGMQTSAYLFAIKADYLIKDKYSAGAGIDYLSGQDYSSNDPDYLDRSHSFDNLYGIRHRFYGHMDLFNNLPESTRDGGLIDAYLKLKWIFVENAHIGADLHFFSLQNNVIDNSSEILAYYTKGLGQELDLNFSWDINKIFNVKGGYSLFLVTDSMEKLQGIEPGNSRFPTWIWVMVTAKPVFLDTSQK